MEGKTTTAKTMTTKEVKDVKSGETSTTSSPKRKRFECQICGRSDVQFSKSQMKKLKRGKAGECKKCVEDRVSWRGKAQAAQWAKPGGSEKGRPKKKTKINKEHKEEEEENTTTKTTTFTTTATTEVKEKKAPCNT